MKMTLALRGRDNSCDAGVPRARNAAGTAAPHGPWLRSLSLILLLLAVSPRAASGDDRPAILRDVGFDQHLDAQAPLDASFSDESGATVKLGDYFGRKPVILVLAYYRCPMLCTLVLNGVVQGMRGMTFTPGADYEVVVVSFDPRETHELAAAKKTNYAAEYGRPGAAEGLHFLTGKLPDIQALTRAVGFRYVYDAAQDQYIHTSGIMILTPQGKVSRYFFGIHFLPRDLRLGLVEASANKIGSPTDQVLLYCFHYDPATGKYSASILNFVRVGGAVTMLALAGMIVFLLRRGGPQTKSGRVGDGEMGRVEDRKSPHLSISLSPHQPPGGNGP
jgi:protein SCO1